MRLLSVFILAAIVAPVPVLGGGNILNGPKNCLSLAGEASDDTGQHAGRLSYLCSRLAEGNINDAEYKELVDAGVEMRHHRYGN